MHSSPNFNIAWCRRMVAKLLDFGADTFYISPGYRDAPMIAAIQAEQDTKLVSVFDERAAGYMALGYAKATKRPAVLVCTSGTAGANYLPAVIEAQIERIPLIILTCDRPLELLFAGANQAIDHGTFFTGYRKGYLPLPPPSADLSTKALDVMVGELVRKAVEFPQGSVHINVPLRSPLEPVSQAHPLIESFDNRTSASQSYVCSKMEPHEQILEPFAKACGSAQKGLLVLGRISDPRERDGIERFARQLSWPVYADICSGLKFKFGGPHDLELPYFRKQLDNYQPDMIVHLGGRLTSKYLDSYIEANPPKDYWIFTGSEWGQNTAFTPCHKVMVSSFAWLDRLELPEAKNISWPSTQNFYQKANEVIHEHGISLPFVANQLWEFGTDDLFLGNSSAIRGFDTWLFSETKGSKRIWANRGASGIEGLLATAMGLCQGLQKPVDVVLGDISMLHDLNSIFQLAMNPLPVRIFCLNNQGGGIFAKLPVGKFPKLVDPFITTPHKFGFSRILAEAGLTYHLVDNKADFTKGLQAPLRSPEFFELKISTDNDVDIFTALKKLDEP